MPLWFELLALGLIILIPVAYLGAVVVLWRVRLRFPLSSLDARLTPQDEREAALQVIVQPNFRRTTEAQHPSPHQARVRLPEELSPPPTPKEPPTRGRLDALATTGDPPDQA